MLRVLARDMPCDVRDKTADDRVSLKIPSYTTFQWEKQLYSVLLLTVHCCTISDHSMTKQQSGRDIAIVSKAPYRLRS